jgi:hypothetical protein
MDGLNDNNEGIENQDQEVQELINSFQDDSSVEATMDIPEKIGDLDLDQFQSAIVEATGQKVNSYQELQELIRIREEFDQVRQERDRLSQLSELSPFENDFVKQVNTLFKSNASMEEIQQFVNIQSLDIENMDNLEALRMHLKKQMGPKYTQSEIDALIEDRIEDFGDLEDEDNHIGRAKLKQAAEIAKQELANLKVDVGLPESVKKQKQEQEAYNNMLNKWNGVNSQLLGSKNTHSISYELPSGETGHIDFPVEKEVMLQFAAAASNAAAAAKLPINRKSYDEGIMPYINQLVWGKYGPQILAQALGSKVNEAVDKTNQKYANVDPLDRGSNPTVKATSNNKGSDFKRLIFEKRGVAKR